MVRKRSWRVWCFWEGSRWRRTPTAAQVAKRWALTRGLHLTLQWLRGSNCYSEQGQAPSRDEGNVGRPGAEREQQVRGCQGRRPYPPSMEGYTNCQDSFPSCSYPAHKAAHDLCPPTFSGAATLVLLQCLEQSTHYTLTKGPPCACCKALEAEWTRAGGCPRSLKNTLQRLQCNPADILQALWGGGIQVGLTRL